MTVLLEAGLNSLSTKAEFPSAPGDTTGLGDFLAEFRTPGGEGGVSSGLIPGSPSVVGSGLDLDGVTPGVGLTTGVDLEDDLTLRIPGGVAETRLDFRALAGEAEREEEVRGMGDRDRGGNNNSVEQKMNVCQPEEKDTVKGILAKDRSKGRRKRS